MKNCKAALTKLPQTIGRRLVEGAKILQKGDARTRLSCLLMGFGSLTHGQVMKGLLYFAFEIFYFYFFFGFGWQYLKDFGTLGTAAQERCLLYTSRCV